MKKRIISIILLSAFILSAFSFSAMVYGEETIISQYQKEIDFLKEIKLLTDKFELDKKITRGEAANLVVSIIYPDLDFMIEPEEGLFADVGITHQYYSQIKACKDLNIVKGDYNNNFYPDEFISVTDFTVMMVNAFSYNLYADIQGGYPSGYLMIAKTIGMTNGIDVSSDILKSDVAAKIIYNSLFADSVELSEISNGSVSVTVNSNKNFLSQKLGIFEYDAVVIDNGFSSLYGSSVCDGERIVIEENGTGNIITAYTDGANVIDYLGLRVKVFIRNNMETGKFEMVYIAPHKNMKLLELNSSDIVNVTTNYVEYEENPDSSVTKKLNLSVAPKIVYNGAVYIGKNVSDYIPKDGLVKFIDSDNDGRYDIVNILSFNYMGGVLTNPARNIVVDTIILTPGEERINCRFNPGASLNLNDDEYDYVFVGSEFSVLADLKKNDIVSIAECPNKINGKTFYYIAVLRNTVSGIVQGTSNNTLYLDDGNEYDLSDSITNIKPSYIKTIDYSDITLYLDITGKVAYSEGKLKAAKNYAYMINMAKKQDSDSYMMIKIFTKEGTIEHLPLAGKVTIDGKVCDTVNLQEAALLKRDTAVKKISGDTVTSRPIIYKKNSQGYITNIDTDCPNYTTGIRSEVYVKQTSIPYTIEEVDDADALKAAYRNAAFADVEGRTKSAGGKFFITTDTVIMAVPEIDTYGLSDAYTLRPYVNGNSGFNIDFIKYHELDNIDENYKILYAVDIAAKPYDIQGYDVDPDTGIASFAVIRGNLDPVYELAHGTKMSVFLRTNEAYDEELEKIVTKVYYNLDGVEISATIDTELCYYPYRALINGSNGTDNPYKATIEKLEPGDIIRVATAKGKITHIERVFEVDKVSALYPIALYTQLSASRYTNATLSRSAFPFDTTTYKSHMAQTYAIINSYVKSVKGTTARIISASSTTTTLGSIDMSTINSYNDMFISYAGVVPTVVTIEKDGTTIRVEQGSLNDIITIDEAGGIRGASFVVTKTVALNVQQMLIINGLENLVENRI